MSAPPDPWFFQRWAIAQKVGSPARKMVLTTLALHAESTTGVAYPSQATIAEAVECRERSVRDHLGALEEAGLVARRRRFRRDGARTSDEYLLLAPTVSEWPDGTPVDHRQISPQAESATGEDSPPNGQAGVKATDISPAPARGGVRGGVDDVPPDFPDELRPHARHVMRVLRDLAERHGAKAVTARSLGNVMMARPRKPLVRAAHDFAAWADGKGRRQRDVVAGYRNWLDRCDDLAAVEPMPGKAQPEPAGRGATPIREPRNAMEREQQRQARRLAVARGDGVPSAPYPIERGGE